MVDEGKTSPQGGPLNHWVEWKIPPTSAGLTEHVKPDRAREGLNDLHEATYVGPWPPRQLPAGRESACLQLVRTSVLRLRGQGADHDHQVHQRELSSPSPTGRPIQR